MTITARWADAEHTAINFNIDGQEGSCPGPVEKTFLRDPQTDAITKGYRWSSGNRERQLVADEYDNKGVEIPEFETPPVTAEQIKAEAQRRIEDIMPMWMVARQVSGGDPIPDEVKEQVQAIREKSNELEETLPVALTEDETWK